LFPKYPNPTVSILICTLNEEFNLPYVLPKIPDWVDEILLVDGHSIDKTVDLARQLCPTIKILTQPGRGKGDALRYGLKNLHCDVVVTIDADGSTNPQELSNFISPLIDGNDFAKGSRFLLCSPADKASHRIIGNLLLAITFNILYSCTFTDICSGYNAFWRKSLNQIDFSSKDSLEDEPLLIARAKKSKLNMVEVGHIDCGRINGTSKSPSWRQGFKAIKTLVRERIDG
jgi:glycosyltransferase involved in cell wall biosynthesis